MIEASELPDGFGQLAPFAQRWAVPSTAARAELRGCADAEDLERFHSAVLPLVDAALDYLDTKALDDLCERDQRLMNLLLAFIHVALAVEVQGPDEVKHTRLRARMRIDRSPAD